MLHSPFPDTIHDKEEPSPSVLADRLHSFLLMDTHISLRTPACGERAEGRLLQPPEPVLPDGNRDPAPDFLHHERHLPRRHGTETGGSHLPLSRVFLFLQRLHFPNSLRIHGNHDDAKGNVLRAVQPGQVVLPRRPDAHRGNEPHPDEPRDRPSSSSMPAGFTRARTIWTRNGSGRTQRPIPPFTGHSSSSYSSAAHGSSSAG